ncbi:MAG: serine/threonine protein kinase [SAR86 cluster bacterium]|uniref:Stress response kinase A n=1 Tax=SAR86 cluster bacterium TaxID=2030880 RepID=A0A2A5CBJ3_9GAMM|nr:MAG: serine/threonine protein kinase [SAR86 cluster bacterium]
MENESAHPFARLSPDMVIDAVESSGLISDARILALNSYENRVYQVGIEESEPIIVKFYRPMRWTTAQIMEEHDFSLELAELEIPLVPPVKNAEGETLLEFKGFRFAIFERKGGYPPEFDNLDNLLVMGRFLGRMHQVGAMHDFQTRNTLSIELFAEKSVSFLLQHDFLPASLLPAYESLAKDLIDRMQMISKDSVQPKLIRLHGDCHIGNVLWRDNTPHFVDLDDCMMGPAIQDLWMLLSGNREQRLQQLAEIVDGYNEFYHFNPSELALIETYRTLRLMHYSAWLARRWDDPAFPKSFPWFNTENYWAGHILELREQLAALDEAPLVIY